jgi:hypothetical protein
MSQFDRTDLMTRTEFEEYIKRLRSNAQRRKAAHEAVGQTLPPGCVPPQQSRPFWATRPPSSPAAEHQGKFYPRMHIAGIEHADPNAPRSDT